MAIRRWPNPASRATASSAPRSKSRSTQECTPPESLRPKATNGKDFSAT